MPSPPTKLLVLFSVTIASACAVAGDEETPCDGADVLPEICEALRDPAIAAGKADEIPELRGIVVERVGNRTLFKIPLAYTVGGDHRRLLDETIDKFTSEIGRLNQAMIARGVDLTAILDHASSEAFENNYLDTLERIFDTGVHAEMEERLSENYARPRELWVWQRYLVPQAFIAYFSTKFSVNVGIGGGVSATVLVVVQPWLVLEVDHTESEPRVVDKAYEVDVAVLGVPNVDVGVGVGGGLPLRIGAGAVFGPLDRPEDLAGWGVGLSGSFSIPIVGGGQAKFITVLQHPPLFLGMAGYSTGTSAGFEIHGNLQYIMDLNEFLSWIAATTGFGGE